MSMCARFRRRRSRKLYPHLNISDVVGAVHLPLDGQCDPGQYRHGVGQGGSPARRQDRRERQGLRFITKDGRVTGVSWARRRRGARSPPISCQLRGMWARDLAARSKVTLPLHACEHFLSSSPRPSRLTRLPVLRVPDECAYYKEDAGKMMLGAFEPKAKPWGMDGIPRISASTSLPEDFEHFEPILEMGRQPHADAGDGRYPHVLQRPGELHPRRPLLSRRSAGIEAATG
jgi:glycine/D-amino acid oxidase-like deaminating enzyme